MTSKFRTSRLTKLFCQLKSQIMATKVKCLEIRADEGFIDELDRLANASGISKSAVIDRAVGLYAHALKKAQEGKDIKFVDVGEDLSPSTQKVVNAAVEVTGYGKETWLLKARIAAALEAAADVAVPENYSGCTGDIDWDLGMESRNECIRDALLDIVDELRGTTTTTTETP